MKRYFTAVLLLLPMLLTGCLKWDYSECPPNNNFALRFRLVDANGGDLLAGTIRVIDVALFDEQDNFVLHRRVERNTLEDGHSIRFSVAPGTYRVVCWGNVMENSRISNMSAGAMFTDSYVEVVSNETGCPLYYAPARSELTRAGVDYTDYTVVLPPNQVVEKELNFVRAHRTVKVYINGLENLAAHDGRMPSVQISNVPYRYDFFQRCDPGRRNYSRTTQDVEVTGQGTMAAASINAPITPMEEDMIVRIRRASDGADLFEPLDLKQWVADNTPEYINEFSIYYNVDGNANVTITLPEWDEVGVNPEK